MEKLVSRAAQTRARLIEAATEVFSTAGLSGATTREIARVAGVNEVTLFRHFHNKEQLLAAVIQQATSLQAEALAHQDEWTQNLHIDLMHYAKLCSQMMVEHEALIRTFIGEAKRHPEAARLIVYQTNKTLREQLVAYLKKGQEKGTVRLDVNLNASVDSFCGMLLHGMLRLSDTPDILGYGREEYIETCVDMFVRGISTCQINE
ncbi:TetR/AcrR family transcriptional regulator [Calothrix sp. PCC 7507]|uniref:TetR/AcrR family transcriptional regulator n=1 Tax=Calothrix sp. PCC 7507 TaxID=99598 RepID=UPI00029F44C4|nr:TetR/AcrR family transcriptional regulator [Calothrix sp. PCC 7507]AFY35942.1 transcriptional regulator, TetR family [Calothrix sp. PCC 7507]